MVIHTRVPLPGPFSDSSPLGYKKKLVVVLICYTTINTLNNKKKCNKII